MPQANRCGPDPDGMARPPAGRRPLVAAVLAVVLGIGMGTGCSADGSADFVTRSGNRLLLDGTDFRFLGINVWNANSRSPNSLYTCGEPVDLAEVVPELGEGISVVRTWFFQRQATTADGARNWSTFDHTLETARRAGVKVIAVLGNQYANCEGYPSEEAGFKTVDWYRESYRTTPPPNQSATYRQWVEEVVTRYRDDPTIMLWEMVNESEAPERMDGPCPATATATDALYAFVTDIGGLIRGLDPNHLISVGTIGGGQCGVSGLEYVTLHSPANVDVTDYHDYSLDEMPGDRWNGLHSRL